MKASRQLDPRPVVAIIKEHKYLEDRWNELPPDKSWLVGPGEAAKYLGVSRSTLHYWDNEGILKAIMKPDGRRAYFLGNLWVFKKLRMTS